MLKRLALALAALTISAFAMAQTPVSKDMIGPIVIVTPHIQDLGSYDFTIGNDSSNGELVRTTVTLALVQDSKGNLAGKATVSSNIPVSGQPAITLPLEIPVKGKLKASAKSANFGLREPTEIRLDKDETVKFPNDVTLNEFGTNPPLKYRLTTESQVVIQKNTLVIRDNASTVTLTTGTLIRIPAGTEITYPNSTTATLEATTFAYMQSWTKVGLPGLRAYNVLNSGGSAYTFTLKGKNKIAGGADFHSRTVSLSISGSMKHANNDVIRLDPNTLESYITYNSKVAMKGLGPEFNFTSSHVVKGKNWVGIKPLVDIGGRKPLADPNSKYVEVAYPGGYEIVPATIFGDTDNATLSFKGKNISTGGNHLKGFVISTTLPLNPSIFLPESVNFATKNGIEIMSGVLSYVSEFIIVDFPPQ